MGKPITQDEIAAIYLRQQQKLFLTALSYTDSMYAAEEIVGDTIVAALEAKVIILRNTSWSMVFVISPSTTMWIP